MRKVAITGGAGFIGLNLARALAAGGTQVDIIDNFARGRSDADFEAVRAMPGVRVITLNLGSPGATDELDDDYTSIVHLAALLGVANVIRNAYNTLVVNVQLTVEALRLAARQKSLQSFVFASTSEIYAGSLLAGLLSFPTPETSTLALPSLAAPRTSYMLSKLYGEAMCLQSGVPTVIVRPHNVYGPRMGLEHVVPELMKRMRSAAPGSAVPIYSPTHSRTFCYVDDAVEIILRLAASPDALGRAWNVGTESPEYTIIQVAEVVRRAVGADIELTGAEETAGSPTRRCPSMAASDALTGHRDRVSLEEGISKTLQWYHAAGLV